MTLPVDYSELQILLMAVFAFIGIMRGWYREGITALFVAFLAIMVWQPELAEGIIGWINDLVRLLMAFLRSGFSLQPSAWAAQSVNAEVVIVPSSYRFWMTITAILIVISYLVGEASFKGKITPLGRLLGGILGAANGFVLLSLARQYLTDYWVAQGRIVAASGELSIELTNVPAGSFVGGSGIIFVLVILIAVIGLLIAGDRLGLPLK